MDASEFTDDDGDPVGNKPGIHLVHEAVDEVGQVGVIQHEQGFPLGIHGEGVGKIGMGGDDQAVEDGIGRKPEGIADRGKGRCCIGRNHQVTVGIVSAP